MPADSKSLKSIAFYRDARLKRLVQHACAEHPKAPRKAVDVLRVGLWFEEMRARLDCPTAYSLGQAVQPHAYKKGLYHNNLWAKYAGGRHVPSAETLRACARKLPGSDDLFASPAWNALDASRPLEGRGDALLRHLRPSIQSVVFEEHALEKGRYVRRRALRVPLRRLEGQADLQSLAATVVLLRDAHEAGDRAGAFTIGRSLHRTLLMATVGGPLRFISLELFEFFIRIIFPMAAEKDFAMDLRADMLSAQAGWLRRAAMQLHAAGRKGFALNGNTRQLRRLLGFDFGFDLLYGMAPRLKLLIPPEEASPEVRNHVATHNAGCEWGVAVLSAGKCVPLGPEYPLGRSSTHGGSTSHSQSATGLKTTLHHVDGYTTCR